MQSPKKPCTLEIFQQFRQEEEVNSLRAKDKMVRRLQKERIAKMI